MVARKSARKTVSLRVAGKVRRLKVSTVRAALKRASAPKKRKPAKRRARR